MSQRTRDEIVAEVGFRLGLDVSSGSDCELSVIDALRDAQRRVWNAKKWKERRAQTFLTTVAQYNTGTVTLTNGSTTVTGSGTTWTAAMTGRKFSLGLGSPHYVFTYVSATSGTLAQAYVEPSISDSTYVIFPDEYDVATDVGQIVQIGLERPEWGGRMVAMEETALDGAAFVHAASGQPRYWSRTNSTTTGTYRIRVWPIPDGAYRMRVRYWKTCSDFPTGGSVSDLGDDKERILLYATILECQTLPGAVAITNEDQVVAMIDRAYTELNEDPQVTFRRKRIDQGGQSQSIWLDADSAMSGFM